MKSFSWMDARVVRLEYDSGDHVHPNDRGYRVMAEAIELSRFRMDDDQD